MQQESDLPRIPQQGSSLHHLLAYLLVLAGFLLSAGRLADLHGFRRVFIAGFAVFTLGSLLCGLSGNITELVGSRVLQGIGGAALEALAPAMILHYLPARRRGWAIGILATVISLGIAAGPILGGFITEFLSWQLDLLTQRYRSASSLSCSRSGTSPLTSRPHQRHRSIPPARS